MSTRRLTKPNPRKLLLPGEVAEKMRVDPKTVSRWAKDGRIPEWAMMNTLGGHRRFYEDWVIAYVESDEETLEQLEKFYGGSQ